TGEPLTAAVVRLIEAHRSEPSHQDGGFAFRAVPAGSYTLTVERIGYRARSLDVALVADSTRTLRIELQVAAVQLGELIVTGTLGVRRGNDVLSPNSVISGADLDRRLGGTVAATIEQEPGVAVTSIGPATARPVIRGMGGDRIVMLEDGARTGDLSALSADHAVASEALTAQRFEVVRGPMSLLYGSSALGGVVNVVKEEIPEARPDDTHGGAVLQGTSVNTGFAAGAFATGPLGPLGVRAEGSVRRWGDVRTPEATLENTGGASESGSLGLGVSGGSGHAGAAYRYYANRYGIPGGFVGGHAEGVDIDMLRHSVRAEAALHRGVAPFTRLRGHANLSDYRHLELTSSGAVGTRFDQTLAAVELAAVHERMGIAALGALGARLQYRDIRTGGSLRTPSTYDWSLAGFVVEEVGRGKVRGQLGARYDFARYVPRDTTETIFAGGRRIPIRPRTFGSFSGSAGVLYAPVTPVRLGASVARAYRTPDFNELYSDGPHLAANSYDVGDPSLEEETGLGVDVFARVSTEPVTAEAALFGNWLSNYIFPSSRGRAERGTQGGVPRFQYSNEDVRFVGAEGQVELAPHRRWVLTGTASLVRARFTSARDSIPLFDGADTSFVAASVHPPLIPPLRGSVGVRHERPTWFVGTTVRLSAAQDRLGDFEARTDAYALLDLVAGVRLRRWGSAHALTLRLENATDATYHDHLSRIKELMPEPGMSASLMYRLVY
ncbi:MAG TPA: TonB-dependent receptor, partial [Longimicrobiales bacterium]|nr:TonB-dependent receptor [Longimicrobiales bacterium]